MLNTRGASLRLARRPGSQRASRACGGHGAHTGAPRRVTCEAPPIRHGKAVTPSPPGKGAGLCALGRGSPTVAPLRVRVARSVMVEGGGDLLRRPTEAALAPPAMHRCGEPLHSRPVPPRQPTSCGTPDRPTIPRTTRAATVPPGRQRTSDITPKPLQAAPARKVLAALHMRFRPQAKRRGVRGQPWCCLGLAATGRPLVLSHEWERTALLARATGK